MAWLTNEEDSRMLLDISSPMNNIIKDQLTLNFVDISLNNMRQILCKSSLCFAKIWKIDYSKSPNLVPKILNVHLAQLSTDFGNLDLKIYVCVCFIQNKKYSENSTEDFCSIVDQTSKFFLKFPASYIFPEFSEFFRFFYKNSNFSQFLWRC